MTAFRWMSAEINENPARYDLLLYIGKNKYCYAFFDNIQRSIAGVNVSSPESTHDNSVVATLKHAVTNESWLGIPVKTCKVCFYCHKNTLIPSALFESKSVNDYLAWVTDVEEKEIVTYDYISQLDGYNVYAVPKKFFKKIKAYFTAPEIRSVDTVLIYNLLRENKGTRERKLFVFKEEDLQHIYLIDNGKLIFSNSFFYETEEDFTYYILAVCEQLRLNTHSLSIILSGNIEKDDAYYNLLSNYLEVLSLAECPKGIYFPPDLQSAPVHQMYHLYALSLCE